MSQYTKMVRSYYQENRPEQLTTMSEAEVEALVHRLSTQITERVEQLIDALDDQEPAEQGYLARVGQLTNQQQRARERAIAEVLPTDEAGMELL